MSQKIRRSRIIRPAPVFLVAPGFLVDVGVEVVDPALAALLADAARKLLGYVRPRHLTVCVGYEGGVKGVLSTETHLTPLDTQHTPLTFLALSAAATKLSKMVSSSGVHEPFTTEGFRTFVHLQCQRKGMEGKERE